MTRALVVVFLALFNDLLSAQYYMDLTGMRSLAALETQLSRSFLDHYRAELKRVSELEELLNEQERSSSSQQSPVGYVSNAAGTYKLFKRFATKWQRFTQFQAKRFSHPAYDRFQRLYRTVQSFKSYTDLTWSVHAIIRLQETYNINVTEFSNGFDGYSPKLTLYDVFLIGQYACSLRYFRIAKVWLQEALDRFRAGPDKNLHRYDKHFLLQLLSYAYYEDGDFEEAVLYGRVAVKLRDTEETNSRLKAYKKGLWYSKHDNTPKAEKRKFGPKGSNKHWLERSGIMCRDDEQTPQRALDKLSCYDFKPSHEFYLKPMQLEEKSHDPLIWYVHNFLSESEADQLVTAARGRVDLAEIVNPDGAQVNEHYRTSKSTWFNNSDGLPKKIKSRLARFTNLDVRYVEDLQVATYGVGGNYEAHYDHASYPQDYTIFKQYSWGNRIATLIMYLSDVAKGGYTVFTKLPGAIIHPKKGGAAFWYNLRGNGDEDERTMHAGCPVLIGEKWVANYWLHEWGQEFKRPCTLKDMPAADP